MTDESGVRIDELSGETVLEARRCGIRTWMLICDTGTGMTLRNVPLLA